MIDTAPSMTETLYTLLDRRTRENPDRTCVVFTDGRAHTRAEVRASADRVAGALEARGVSRGDRVVLMVDNRVEFLHVVFAAARIGAIVVPVNTASRGRILAHVLELTKPVVAVVSSEYAGRVAEVDSQAVEILTVEDGLEGVASTSTPLSDGAATSAILFTSGTTGPSKGVAWPHRMGLYDAYLSCLVMDYRESDVLYTALPLFHINALFTSFFAGLLVGAPVVVAPRFSASGFWSDIRAHQATSTSLLGTMATILWRQQPCEEERDNTLRNALVIPSPKGYYESFERRFGLRMTQVYGSTDMSIPIGIPWGESRPGSCGRVMPGWECQIVDENDERVPAGDVGELVVRPTLPFIGQLGYWEMPDATLQAWRNLWFHTGDLFRVEDGWFYYVGRNKDAIRKAGENVSAFEVELAVLDFAGVEEVAVIGVPSELGEEEVAAVIVAANGVHVDPQALRGYLEESLPFFAVPRYLAFVERLPKTETQKVRKEALRATLDLSLLTDLGAVRASRPRR